MFYVKSIFYKILFILLLLNSRTVVAGLLPESIVETGKNEFKMVQDLKKGDTVISMAEDQEECRLYKTEVLDLMVKDGGTKSAILLELRDSDGKSGLLMVGEDQKFYRMDVLHKLKPKLINSIKKGKEKYLNLFLNAIWASAGDLKVGDRIRGSQYNELEVVKAERVEFNSKVDLVELSLKEHHTFYLIDSEGHYVLTHNIGVLTCIWIGALIGGIAGGGYAAWKSHKKGILSVKTVAKATLVGVLVGGFLGFAIHASVLYRLDNFSHESSVLVKKISEHVPLDKFMEIIKPILNSLSEYKEKLPEPIIKFLKKIKDYITTLSEDIDVAGIVFGQSFYACKKGGMLVDKIVDDAYDYEYKQVDWSHVDDPYDPEAKDKDCVDGDYGL